MNQSRGTTVSSWFDRDRSAEAKQISRLLREGSAAARLLAAQFGLPPIACERMESAPVMVIPGFTMSDFHTRLMRRTLRACGVEAIGWGQGVNRGSVDAAKLQDRLDDLVAKTGRQAVLIGWSWGGFFASDLAEKNPDRVSMVVTLGTPFAYRRPRRRGRDSVHTVACWSPYDDIVPSSSARGRDGEIDLRIKLNCTHCEMVSDREALAAVVGLLREHPVLEWGSRVARAQPEFDLQYGSA